MLKRCQISGTWVTAEAECPPEIVSDYIGGLLVTETADDAETRGPPEAFRTAMGETGLELIARILRPPTVHSLRYGAVRESIAAARSVAEHGFVETRAWDSATQYVVAPGDGSCGVIRFAPNHQTCVGAMINYDPWREYDTATVIADIPEDVTSAAHSVRELPLLNSPSQLGISCMFWSAAGDICAGEPWPVAYKFGAELLRRELLDDSSWQDEAATYYDIGAQTLRIVLDVARRRCASNAVIALTEDEFAELVPDSGEHRSDAIDLLNVIRISSR